MLAGVLGCLLQHGYRFIRYSIGAGLAVVVFTALLAWPNTLGFFSIIIGGPSNGRTVLSDSNIDWGQDLKNLRRFLDAHPRDNVKMSYFGTADPEWYGLKGLTYFEYDTNIPLWHPPSGERELADFTPGTYVYSLTNLQRTYVNPEYRQWSPAMQRRREQLEAALRLHLGGGPLPKGQTANSLSDALNELLYLKLTIQLWNRWPDAIIGSSLYLFDLDEDEFLELMR